MFLQAAERKEERKEGWGDGGCVGHAAGALLKDERSPGEPCRRGPLINSTGKLKGELHGRAFFYLPTIRSAFTLLMVVNIRRKKSNAIIPTGEHLRCSPVGVTFKPPCCRTRRPHLLVIT